jgi:hypothetical protein
MAVSSFIIIPLSRENVATLKWRSMPVASALHDVLGKNILHREGAMDAKETLQINNTYLPCF